MIKFFRKIRQNLLMENKTGKPAWPVGRYFKYAIGEIILVVIGILIALQINNWNENRKLRNQEFKILIEVKSNLESTLNNFEKDTLYNLNSIQQLYKIIQYITEDLPYNKELDGAFLRLQNWGSPYPISNAYKTLQTKGLDLISNEKLRSDIVDIHEYKYDLLKSDYDKSEWIILQAAVIPFTAKHIRLNTQHSIPFSRPNDYESLKKNVEFINILEQIIATRKSGLRLYRNTMESIDALINNIDEYLSSID